MAKRLLSLVICVCLAILPTLAFTQSIDDTLSNKQQTQRCGLGEENCTKAVCGDCGKHCDGTCKQQGDGTLSNKNQTNCGDCGKAHDGTCKKQDNAEAEALKRERDAALREVEGYKKALKQERDMRLSAEQRAAAAQRRKIYASRIDKGFKRRFAGVRRAKSSGNRSSLSTELEKLRVWKNVVDKDGQLKRVARWWSKQRQEDLEEIIGSKAAIAWLDEAVGVQDPETGVFDGDLPKMLGEYQSLQGGNEKWNLTGIRDAAKAGRDGAKQANDDIAALAFAQGIDLEEARVKYAQHLEEEKARKNSEGEEEEASSFNPWWIYGPAIAVGVVILLLVLNAKFGRKPAPVRRAGAGAGGGARAGGAAGAGGALAPAPTITRVNPDTGPQAGGTPIAVEGTDLNAPIVLFRKLGETDQLATAMLMPNPALITFQTPAFPVDGAWVMVVRNADGQEDTHPFDVTP